MRISIITPYFSFAIRKITARFSEQITDDNLFSRNVAEPLFSADLCMAGIIEQENYDSGPAVDIRNRHVFTLLLQGQMEILLDEHRRTIGPGALVLATAGTRLRRTGNGPTWWLYFELYDTERWRPLKQTGPYIREYENATLMFLHLRNILDAKNKGPQSSTLAPASARFLVRLLTQEMTMADKGLSRHMLALERLMDEIVRHPQRQWTLDDMTECTSISRSHLSALFKKQHGLSPMEAVIKQRMQQAIHLLIHEKLSVKETASAVGYQSAYSFTRLFTKYIGKSPVKYRAQLWRTCTGLDVLSG